MHRETLAPSTAEIFARLSTSGIVAPETGLYLAGGTALALHLGHRQSEDLDFFTENMMVPERIIERLQKLGHLAVTQEEERTINAVLDDVKVSFISFPYPQLYPLMPFEHIHLADKRDIAAMKLSAIVGRGAKKDFFDLYALMREYPLEDMVSFFEKKFAEKNYNRMHVLKSIAYFDDAESDPDPIMLSVVRWEDVKSTLSRETHRLAG